MTDSRRPGRPKAGAQQVGRERIVEGVIEYVRAGHSDISRREISIYLGITPALITYYFPKGFSLLTEAIERQSSHWRASMDNLCEQEGLLSSQMLDQLQRLIIAMYTTDSFIIDVQSSLWRAGHMPYCLVSEMKRKASTLFLSGDAQVGQEMASVTTSIIWGACEHCVRDHKDDLRSHIFNSEALLSGHLIVALRTAPALVAISSDA